MTSVRWAVVVIRCRDGRKCGEIRLKAVRNRVALSRGAEPFHRPFPLTGRLMGILAPAVEIVVAVVLSCRHCLPVCER